MSTVKRFIPSMKDLATPVGLAVLAGILIMVIAIGAILSGHSVDPVSPGKPKPGLPAISGSSSPGTQSQTSPALAPGTVNTESGVE